MKQPLEESAKILPLTSIEITDNLIDLGIVENNTIISKGFPIKNIGNEDLHISDITPDCTCTQFIIAKTIIHPGDSTILTIVVDTENKFGKNSITTTFVANTAYKFHFTRINFEVDGFKTTNSAEWYTKELDLGSLEIKDSILFTNLIKNNTPDTLLLYDIFTSCRCLSVTRKPDIILPDDTGKISFLFKPEDVGRFKKKAVAIINDNSMIEFYLTGTIKQ